MTHRTAAARGVVLAILLIPLLLPASALGAGDHGFQIEVSGMLAKPFGAYSTGENAQDLLDLGGRVSGKLLFGMNRGFCIGAWAAYLKNQKDFTTTSIMDTGQPFDVNGTRTLIAIPVEALFQFRSDTRHRVSGYVEGGAGITSYTWRLSELSADFNGNVFTFPPDNDIQQAFSFHFGGGAVFGLGRDWEVVTGLVYQQSIVRGGEVWNTDDDPKYALLSLGVRYPRW
jgi:hypothetical protein